jgi:hypothetical protein
MTDGAVITTTQNSNNPPPVLQVHSSPVDHQDPTTNNLSETVLIEKFDWLQHEWQSEKCARRGNLQLSSASHGILISLRYPSFLGERL